MSFPQSSKACRAFVAAVLVFALALPAAAGPRVSRELAPISWLSWIAEIWHATLPVSSKICILGSDGGSCIDPDGGKRAGSLCALALATGRGSCIDQNGQTTVGCYGSCIDPEGNH